MGLAKRMRELGAEVRVCAPPDEDFAQRLAGVGVPLETRARATAVAGTICTDWATVAARLLLDALSRKEPPMSA
ncbi:hypothetical protein OH799_04125 [Nocardia sp. NBC_00881]|uniref:hypothetical protein n=1 Tax=Nocardia sp. NBC_00881 TaxID=2975995 RepID=UPI003867340B|nr:hypothetical protein OH799_04125 [Nocardia sp. NBC_00881]